jgi:two-component system OmpR family response regulator
MLSAMGEATDRIVGLEVGADDYLAKPCNPRELLARVRAVLRRREQGGAGSRRERRFGDWILDVVARSVRRGDDAPVALTDAEFRVLNVFLDRPQRVLTRDQLLDLAKGGDAEAYDRAIDVTVSRLRRKLGGDDPIRTVRGEGYQFDARVHGT